MQTEDTEGDGVLWEALMIILFKKVKGMRIIWWQRRLDWWGNA